MSGPGCTTEVHQKVIRWLHFRIWSNKDDTVPRHSDFFERGDLLRIFFLAWRHECFVRIMCSDTCVNREGRGFFRHEQGSGDTMGNISFSPGFYSI